MLVAFFIRFYILANQTHITNFNNPCRFIDKIESQQNSIEIKFKQDISKLNPLNLSSYFGYYTSVLDNQLLMPPGSVYQSFINNNTLTLSFSIPFISNYTGLLFCIDEAIYQVPPFQLPIFNETGILFKQKLNLSVSDFRSDLDDTQFLCHGNKPENRWCQVRHIGFSNNKFVMQTKAHFSFPFSFLSLGGRSPPFDSVPERISNEPLLTNRNIAELSVGGVAKDEVAIMTAPCLNQSNTFDLIFDFLIPAYQTIQKIKNDKSFYNNNKFRFFFRNANNKDNIELIQAITGDPPISPPKTNYLLLFDRVVLGLEKADEICDSTRSLFSHYSHIYKYNRENTLGFRETVLTSLNISINSNQHSNALLSDEKASNENSKNGSSENDDYDDLYEEYAETDEDEDSKKKYIITFLDDPSNEKMRIFNIEPLKRLISRSCQLCAINIIDVDSKNLTSLIEIAAKSNVLIARSGVGLEHAIWLRPNSHVIELKPYGFWCEDKYEIAANISGSKYHSVMNENSTVKLQHYQLQRHYNTCLSAKSYCESQECYNVLLEQLIDVDLKIFNQTWNLILEDLQSQNKKMNADQINQTSLGKK